MTAWSQVESLCGFLFRELSQISYEVANTIFDRVGTKEQIEIIAELVESIADAERQDRAAAALKEVSAISVDRNKIVHAGWGLFNGEHARFWHGITTARFERIMRETPKGISDRKRYIFTITDINHLTDRAVSVREQLETLLDEIIQERCDALHAQAGNHWPSHLGMGPIPR